MRFWNYAFTLLFEVTQITTLQMEEAGVRFSADSQVPITSITEFPILSRATFDQNFKWDLSKVS